jgi:hypothetical protein
VDAAHGGGDPTPEHDSTAGVMATGTAPTMSKPVVDVSSSQTQLGATTPEIVPEVDMTTTTGAATTDDGDDDELEVVTGHPGLELPLTLFLW